MDPRPCTGNVECENYCDGNGNNKVNGAKNDNVTLPLNKWLCTAPLLFTLMYSTDDANTAMKINQDVSDTISYAIDQLQVFEMHDLLCVDTPD